MAHSNRKSVRARKKALKAAMKASRRAEYAAMAGTGRNKKKKGVGGKGIQIVKPARILAKVRGVVNGVATIVTRKVHGGGECRNIGCLRCGHQRVTA